MTRNGAPYADIRLSRSGTVQRGVIPDALLDIFGREVTVLRAPGLATLDIEIDNPLR